ncbi:MAG: ribonuclease P protein component [Alistipes sp.]|nr:ribonuclease P protein component [Alistipes sp.]
MPDRSLPRAERLRSLGAIRRLFEEGRSGFVFPFRYIWLAESAANDAGRPEILFSVPKKFHKRANKRNLLRRRTKEAYRLQKQLLASGGRPAALDLALIYSSKEVLPYRHIERAVAKILSTISEQMQTDSRQPVDAL